MQCVGARPRPLCAHPCRSLCSLLAVASASWSTYKLLTSGRPQPAQESALLRWWLVLALLPLYNTWAEWTVSWLPFYAEVSAGAR
jgi:hypothetical protein